MVTSPEDAWDRLTLGADFFLYLRESFIVRFYWDLWRGILFVVAREFHNSVLLGFVLAWCAGSNSCFFGRPGGPFL